MFSVSSVSSVSSVFKEGFSKRRSDFNTGTQRTLRLLESRKAFERIGQPASQAS